MKTSIVLLLLLASPWIPGRPVHAGEPPPASDEAIDRLVQALSWDSVGFEHRGLAFITLPIGEAATELVRIGKPATPRLIRALRDEERAVAAQVVLLEIWKDEKGIPASFEGIQVGEKRGARQSVGVLYWTSLRGPGENAPSEVRVAEADREKARAYWCDKVPAEYRGGCP